MKTIISSLAGASLLIAGSASGQNLYVANYSAGLVQQVTPGGTATTFASGLDHPTSVALDASGNLFVGNSANEAPAAGSITEFKAGGGTSTFATGVNPTAMAFSGGNLFETDYSSGKVFEFAPNGTPTTFASGFTDPISLAFDASGNLFVGSGSGNGNGIITKITPGGVQSPFASGLSFPQGLEFDSAGNLYEADNTSSHIFEFTPGGTKSTFASVTFANQMVFDSSGNMFVTTGNGLIDKITPGGTVSPFSSPGGDPDGIIFVPEPSTAALFGMGVVAFLLYRRNKKDLAPAKA